MLSSGASTCQSAGGPLLIPAMVVIAIFSGTVVRRTLWLAAVVALLPMAGCKRAPRAAPENPAAVAARAAAMLPSDLRLAALYRASCQTCHAHPDSGAPPVGYHYAWDPRWAQGMPTLLSHVIGGYNGMPAGGQCFTCTRDDYQTLIRFMAGQSATAN